MKRNILGNSAPQVADLRYPVHVVMRNLGYTGIV